MMTWAMFLGDDTDVDAVFGAGRLTAAATSAVLHAIVVLGIVAELPQSPARATESSIDVTVELAFPREGASTGKPVGALAAPEPGSISRFLIAEPAPSDPAAPDEVALLSSALETVPAASDSVNDT